MDQAVRSLISRANEYAATYADRHRRSSSFSAGDLVLLDTRNLPLPAGLSRKLAAKWIGPLPVAQAVGPVAYKVTLPHRLKQLHNVFHVSLLKPFEGKAPAF